MLDHFFSLPKTADRIRALWLGPAIERYVAWLDERHASKSTVERHVHTLVRFNRFAVDRGVQTWEEFPAHVEPFIALWMQERGRWCRTQRDQALVQANGRVPVRQMLEVVLPGFVGKAPPRPLPFHALAPGFFPYLTDERGLRPATLQNYLHNLRVFEAFLGRMGVSQLSELTPPLISNFLIERSKQLSPGGVKGCSGTLREFLKYLHRQGITPSDLGRTVPRGREYKQAAIPRAISWADVQRVLDAIDRRSPVGKRDYAVLLLLVSYGLRAREVAALRLEDLDWQQAQLHVPARKGGNSTVYPLSDTVGEAIIDYIRSGRPQVSDRHVFLTVRMPYLPMTALTVSKCAAVRLHAAGIQVPLAGSHTFRHSCVQHLVEADVPFKVIGDYVGHRTQASTQIYSKVALHLLRQLAIGDAEEAL
jgi:site-specific recombinase XerD